MASHREGKHYLGTITAKGWGTLLVGNYSQGKGNTSRGQLQPRKGKHYLRTITAEGRGTLPGGIYRLGKENTTKSLLVLLSSVNCYRSTFRFEHYALLLTPAC